MSKARLEVMEELEKRGYNPRYMPYPHDQIDVLGTDDDEHLIGLTENQIWLAGEDIMLEYTEISQSLIEKVLGKWPKIL